MGQGQSSAQQDEPAADGQDDAQKDYYTLLAVERTATDDEIKKAYRRKALELHPDRNYGDVERTTALFAEIQAAYEVLSDPQERAWYDSHRDQILYGGDDAAADGSSYSGGAGQNVRMTTADDINKILLKFNPKMDFSDSPSGFFGGLRDIFEKLAHEEELACDWDALEPPPFDYPTFGSAHDGADVVKPFYAAWTSFATRKSFAWRDKYKPSDAPDRRVRRAMEKENKRLREDGIREFNESVRSLVAFVKKRDPRYQASVQSEAQRQKSLREAAAAQAARSRAANAARVKEYVVPAWARGEGEEEEDVGDEFASEEEEEVVVDEFECVVCDKVFKSEKQLEAHERSKKHVKALKQLQREMRKENKMMDEFDVEEVRDGQFTPAPGEEEEEDVFTMADESPTVETRETSLDIETSDKTDEAAEENDQRATENEEEDEDDDDYAPRETVESRLGSTTTATNNNQTNADADTDDLDQLQSQLSSTTLAANPEKEPEPSSPHVPVGKAKQRRAKKAAKAAPDPEMKCAVCAEEFSSRTRLFAHIREEGHAQLKTGAVGKGGKKGKKRR